MPILGNQSCELEKTHVMCRNAFALYLEIGKLLGQINSISASINHIRPYAAAVCMVWSKETGAYAGSLRCPPHGERRKMLAFTRVVFSQNSRSEILGTVPGVFGLKTRKGKRPISA